MAKKISVATCDHSTITTAFCPHCGKSMHMETKSQITELLQQELKQAKTTVESLVHYPPGPYNGNPDKISERRRAEVQAAKQIVAVRERWLTWIQQIPAQGGRDRA